MGNAKWLEQKIERFQQSGNGFQQSGNEGSCGRKRTGGRKRKGGRAAKPSKPFQIPEPMRKNNIPEPMRKNNISEDELDLRRTITIANALRSQGKLQEAEALSRQVIDMTKKLFPTNRDRVAAALENYAAVLLRLGRTEEAESYKDQGKMVRQGRSVRTEAIPEIKSETETLPVTAGVEKPSSQPVFPSKQFHPIIVLSNLKTALVHLEYFIKWEAMSLTWVDRRECWLTEVCTASKVKDLARSIVELEHYVTPNCFEEGWSDLRKQWFEECQQASTRNMLIQTLVDPEDYISWGAVRDDWADVRACWGRMIQWNDPN